jgi:hypothetical protein
MMPLHGADSTKQKTKQIRPKFCCEAKQQQIKKNLIGPKYEVPPQLNCNFV